MRLFVSNLKTATGVTPWVVVKHGLVINRRRRRKKQNVLAANLSIIYGLSIIPVSMNWIAEPTNADQEKQENPFANIRGGIKDSWSIRETYQRIREDGPLPEAEIAYWETQVEQASGLPLVAAMAPISFLMIGVADLVPYILATIKRRKRKIDTRNFRRRLVKEKLCQM